MSTHTHIHTHIYTHTYTHICIHAHIHTHKHTHNLSAQGTIAAWSQNDICCSLVLMTIVFRVLRMYSIRLVSRISRLILYKALLSSSVHKVPVHCEVTLT